MTSRVNMLFRDGYNVTSTILDDSDEDLARSCFITGQHRVLVSLVYCLSFSLHDLHP